MSGSAIEAESGEAGVHRAALLAELRSVESLCRGLYALLPEAAVVPEPEPGAWRGPASVAYRGRVARLRHGIDAGCAALRAAEGAL